MSDKKYYRPKEAAAYLGVALSTIWNYVKQGKLRTVKTSKQMTHIPRADLDALVEQAMGGAA